MIVLEVQSCLQARTCPIIAEAKVAQQDLLYQEQQQELSSWNNSSLMCELKCGYFTSMNAILNCVYTNLDT